MVIFYEKLYELVSANIEIRHIQAHISSRLINDDNKKFSIVDRLVRSKLRELTNIFKEKIS